MIELDTEICICNSLTVKDIVDCINENNFTTIEELLKNEVCPMSDKCEACIDEGYNNDGLNIPMVFSMVQKEML